MIYLEHSQPHYFVWPVIAIGTGKEFWIALAWLNCEIGLRSNKPSAK